MLAQPNAASTRAALGEEHVAAVLVGFVVGAGLQLGHHGGDLERIDRRIGHVAGDDQRNPRLVDENRIGLVDDGVVERPLHDLVGVCRQLVAQKIETGFLGRGIGNVRSVGLPARGEGQALLHVADGQAEKTVDRPHPFRIAAGQVVVEGQHVCAVAGQGMPEHRRDGSERLAFACLHFDDLACGQGESGDDLHVIRTQPDGTVRHFPHQGERLGKPLLGRRTGLRRFAQGGGRPAQRLVARRAQPGAELVDARQMGLVRL